MAAACVTTPVTMGSILVKPIICSCAMFKEGAPKSPCSSFKSKAFLCTSSCQQFFSSIPHKKNRSDGVASRLRSSFITSWKAREHLGSHHFVWFSRGKKRESKSLGGTLVQASLLGVGAPEVLVIAVVALLVFGPKGLAEVARTLGKSLRAFQPTIRELQEVSRDFKQTLEKEIGLDELRSYDSQPKSVSTSNEQPQLFSNSNVSTEARAYSAEDYSKVTEEQAKAVPFVPEEQREAAWGPPTKVNGEIINKDATSWQDKVRDGSPASD
ncbi:hypothetical protein O6H91_09G034400 [Diphasiastrum complanatum]|uniref:Uncharacterized protein n=1 Tax=Diphasiastrum complanatum TaxID=34168 RepID=A0ACC2CMZ6_DIPCM|nr:hypothetical protein O6H91_09G034400 [Diphasiastrum complanatum]